MTPFIILGLLGALAMAVTIRAVLTSPVGYEDEAGFHLGSKSADAAQNPDVRPVPAARNRRVFSHIAVGRASRC